MNDMKKFDLARSLALRLVVLSLCLFAASQARASEKETVLRACEREFGAAIDAKQNLFEVNAAFVLRPRFDARGALLTMSVTPKYFFEETHPEWTEPEHWPLLNLSERIAVLARIDSIRPRGRRLWSNNISVVTNMTRYSTDEYEQAFIERGDYGDLGTRFVHLYFMHEVSGVVTRKYRCGDGFSLNGRPPHVFYSVTVGECGYFVSRRTFARLRVGRRARLRATGPMGSSCGVRSECPLLDDN